MDGSKGLILVVEDDEAMLQGLRHNLEFEGYHTAGAVQGREALLKAEKLVPQLVLLDVMLPVLSGFDVLRQLRAAHPRLPVILLTSKNLEADKLEGFRLGADDYVTKPFSIQELLARVQAVLKRSTPIAPAEAGVQIGDIRIDLARREITRAGQPVDLTPREFEVLRLLLRHRGDIVTRERLLHEVWGYDPDNVPATRTVDNHVAKLRQKVGADWIETVQKMGYRLRG